MAVEGDRVSIHRGDVSGLEAARTIDATGYVVCPGFVDLHSHAGLTILGEPHHDPKVRQGVTTELVGIDGDIARTFKTREELERYIWLDSGLNGYPPLPADWLTVVQLLDKYDNSVAINMAYILGNSPVASGASAGMTARPPRRNGGHEGRYPRGPGGGRLGPFHGPGLPARLLRLHRGTGELAGVAARMGGHYHTHTRASLRSQGLMAPWEEALQIGRLGDCPVHLTHYRQGAAGVGSHLDYLGLVERGRDEGMDVTFDCYTYPYSGTTVTIGLPHWAKGRRPGAADGTPCATRMTASA